MYRSYKALSTPLRKLNAKKVAKSQWESYPDLIRRLLREWRRFDQQGRCWARIAAAQLKVQAVTILVQRRSTWQMLSDDPVMSAESKRNEDVVVQLALGRTVSSISSFRTFREELCWSRRFLKVRDRSAKKVRSERTGEIVNRTREHARNIAARRPASPPAFLETPPTPYINPTRQIIATSTHRGQANYAWAAGGGVCCCCCGNGRGYPPPCLWLFW